MFMYTEGLKSLYTPELVFPATNCTSRFFPFFSSSYIVNSSDKVLADLHAVTKAMFSTKIL
ncbi:hypothetical protein Mapa_007002 [Marchantia paleacea]|nr:hypothetical protein Mapa_007002 [Marchantia paleacea]